MAKLACDRCGLADPPPFDLATAHPGGFWLCGYCRPVLSRDEVLCRLNRGKWPAPYAPIEPPYVDTWIWVAPPPVPPEPLDVPRGWSPPAFPPRQHVKIVDTAPEQPPPKWLTTTAREREIERRRGPKWWYREGPLALPVVELVEDLARVPRWVAAEVGRTADPEEALTAWIDPWTPMHAWD